MDLAGNTVSVVGRVVRPGVNPVTIPEQVCESPVFLNEEVPKSTSSKGNGVSKE